MNVYHALPTTTNQQNSNLKQTLAVKGHAPGAGVLIGPEGGFSREEIEQAKAAGFQSISIGKRILRTETAAIVVIGLLQYELGDLGLLP